MMLTSIWIVVVHGREGLFDTDIQVFGREEDADKSALRRLAEKLDYTLTGDDEWDWEEVKKLLRSSDVVYAIKERRIDLRISKRAREMDFRKIDRRGIPGESKNYDCD